MPLPQYSSFEEKHRHFNCKQIINTIGELEVILTEIKTSNYYKDAIWRGVSSSQYKIYSSLQRYNLLNTDSLNLGDLINSAKKNPSLINYFNALGVKPTKYPILSFLQHFSAPSPLIDFTMNPNIALFFMTDWVTRASDNKIDDYMSLYVIPSKNQDGLKIQAVTNDLYTIPKTIDSTEFPHDNFLEMLLEAKTEDCFILSDDSSGGFLTRVKNNLHIANQDGIFMVNKDGTTPLEEALKEMFKINPYLADLDRDLDESEQKNVSEGLERLAFLQNLHSKNLIEVYEIHKDLINHLRAKNAFTKETIYPDPHKMCKEIVELSIASKK